MLTKPCARAFCGGTVRATYASQLKRRRYCTHRCSNLHTAEARRAGHDDAALMRACVAIQKALGVHGDLPPALVRIVRRIRQRAYQAGHGVISNKVRRAVARGQLVVRRSAA